MTRADAGTYMATCPHVHMCTGKSSLADIEALAGRLWWASISTSGRAIKHAIPDVLENYLESLAAQCVEERRIKSGGAEAAIGQTRRERGIEKGRARGKEMKEGREEASRGRGRDEGSSRGDRKDDEKKRVTTRARGAETKHPRERKRQAEAQGNRQKRAIASDREQDASHAVRLDRGGRRQVELVPEVPEEPDDWARLQMMRQRDSQQVPRRHERHRQLKERDQRPMSGRKASAPLPREKQTKRSSKIPVKGMM